MVVSFMTYQYVDTMPSDKPAAEKLFATIVLCIFRPLLTVAVGWVIQAVF